MFDSELVQTVQILLSVALAAHKQKLRCQTQKPTPGCPLVASSIREFTKSTEIVRRRAPITRYEALPCDEGGYWSKSSSPTTFACNEDGSKKKEWKKFVCIKTLSSAYVAIC
ncbi:hypothetical protein BD560DRAFT_486679 [Blakeslea trispora]|nr:hypothetical protein BD560DRAFT_486677 [Blakeslea trispora]KAI8385679.1 hypothetical protein BD560DRAFT_486679 [Blakeslea trispora]